MSPSSTSPSSSPVGSVDVDWKDYLHHYHPRNRYNNHHPHEDMEQQKLQPHQHHPQQQHAAPAMKANRNVVLLDYYDNDNDDNSRMMKKKQQQRQQLPKHQRIRVVDNPNNKKKRRKKKIKDEDKKKDSDMMSKRFSPNEDHHDGVCAAGENNSFGVVESSDEFQEERMNRVRGDAACGDADSEGSSSNKALEKKVDLKPPPSHSGNQYDGVFDGKTEMETIDRRRTRAVSSSPVAGHSVRNEPAAGAGTPHLRLQLPSTPPRRVIGNSLSDASPDVVIRTPGTNQSSGQKKKAMNTARHTNNLPEDRPPCCRHRDGSDESTTAPETPTSSDSASSSSSSTTITPPPSPLVVAATSSGVSNGNNKMITTTATMTTTATTASANSTGGQQYPQTPTTPRRITASAHRSSSKKVPLETQALRSPSTPPTQQSLPWTAEIMGMSIFKSFLLPNNYHPHDDERRRLGSGRRRRRNTITASMISSLSSPSPPRASSFQRRRQPWLDSDEALERYAQQIRNELRQRELAELALEAERAAESGQERFVAHASTYGRHEHLHPIQLNRSSSTPHRTVDEGHEDDVVNRCGSPDQHYEDEDFDSRANIRLAGGTNSLYSSSLSRVHDFGNRGISPLLSSRPSTARRHSSYTEGTKIIPELRHSMMASQAAVAGANASGTSAAAVPKLGVLSLRDANEVLPSFSLFHTHLRTHLARNRVHEDTLAFQQVVELVEQGAEKKLMMTEKRSRIVHHRHSWDVRSIDRRDKGIVDKRRRQVDVVSGNHPAIYHPFREGQARGNGKIDFLRRLNLKHWVTRDGKPPASPLSSSKRRDVDNDSVAIVENDIHRTTAAHQHCTTGDVVADHYLPSSIRALERRRPVIEVPPGLESVYAATVGPRRRRWCLEHAPSTGMDSEHSACSEETDSDPGEEDETYEPDPAQSRSSSFSSFAENYGVKKSPALSHNLDPRALFDDAFDSDHESPNARNSPRSLQSLTTFDHMKIGAIPMPTVRDDQNNNNAQDSSLQAEGGGTSDFITPARLRHIRVGDHHEDDDDGANAVGLLLPNNSVLESPRTNGSSPPPSTSASRCRPVLHMREALNTAEAMDNSLLMSSFFSGGEDHDSDNGDRGNRAETPPQTPPPSLTGVDGNDAVEQARILLGSDDVPSANSDTQEITVSKTQAQLETTPFGIVEGIESRPSTPSKEFWAAPNANDGDEARFDDLQSSNSSYKRRIRKMKVSAYRAAAQSSVEGGVAISPKLQQAQVVSFDECKPQGVDVREVSTPQHDCGCLALSSGSSHSPRSETSVKELEKDACGRGSFKRLRRAASMDSLQYSPHTGPSAWNPFLPDIGKGRSAKKTSPQESEPSNNSGSSFQAAALTMFRGLSPTNAMFPARCRRRALYVRSQENDDFLNNYLYCSKPEGVTIEEEFPSGAEAMCTEPCHDTGIPCGAVNSDACCSIFLGETARRMFPRKTTSTRRLVSLSGDEPTPKVEPESWFDRATEQFDLVLERLAGNNQNPTSSWNISFQAPSLKKHVGTPGMRRTGTHLFDLNLVDAIDDEDNNDNDPGDRKSGGFDFPVPGGGGGGSSAKKDGSADDEDDAIPRLAMRRNRHARHLSIPQPLFEEPADELSDNHFQLIYGMSREQYMSLSTAGQSPAANPNPPSGGAEDDETIDKKGQHHVATDGEGTSECGQRIVNIEDSEEV